MRNYRLVTLEDRLNNRGDRTIGEVLRGFHKRFSGERNVVDVAKFRLFFDERKLKRQARSGKTLFS